ncbi:MAG: hypothetical protein RSB94_06260, partial [Erysipelotrichaceae bacterium]
EKGSILKYLGTNTKVASIAVTDGDMNKEAITKATVTVKKAVADTKAAYTVIFEDGKEPVVSTIKP